MEGQSQVAYQIQEDSVLSESTSNSAGKVLSVKLIGKLKSFCYRRLHISLCIVMSYS